VTLSNKKPKFGPKIATKEWWIQRIKDTPGPKYTELWTHIPKYQLARFKALAEIDYNFLGKELEGAPDHPDNLEEGQRKPNYPVKVHYQPHWFPELRSITWKNYQVWSWLTAAKALQCPISAEADTWHNYLNREQTKLEAAELLGVFKPENFHQELPIEIEWDLNTAPPGAIARPISSIEFDIPEGYTYRNLNKTLDDPRPTPVTRSGLIIKKKFLKLYLEERLQEYLALGGTNELIEREKFMGRNLPDPFYWNLWADLQSVRTRYQYYCVEEHIDPEADDEDSVISWDTQ